MPKVSQIKVQYRGGFRGTMVPVEQLIDECIRFDIVDFVTDKSKVRNCESYCRMQIRIGGRLYVTWHSSELLTNYLQDCKEMQEKEGETIFPIEDCILTVGDDRGYYLQDAPDDAKSSLASSDVDERFEKYVRDRVRRERRFEREYRAD